MLLCEKVRVFVFVGGVVAVYVTACGMAVRGVRRRLVPTPPPASQREIRFRRVIFTFAGMGLLCMAYGYFVEPYWLEVTRVHIESPKLPKGSRPIRIIQITDLHSDPTPRLEDRLPQVIAAEKPDLIVFTGDAINSVGGLAVFRRCLTRLASIAPTFSVRGNWDVDYWKALDLFGNTGARELQAEAVRVDFGGAEIWVAGVPERTEIRIGEVLSKVPAGTFTVFLYHSPDEILAAARQKVDLYLAGHTHGGQVALPIYGALMTDSKFGKRFEAGLYRVDRTWLYVNRGIGMEGKGAPRVRFCARPEVTVIEVSPSL